MSWGSRKLLWKLPLGIAADLGSEGIRVNAISAGPIRTLAAAGVPGFKRMHREFDKIAPLRQEITKEDIGSAAAWLCSDKAAKTTGEVLYIDSGYHRTTQYCPRIAQLHHLRMTTVFLNLSSTSDSFFFSTVLNQSSKLL